MATKRKVKGRNISGRNKQLTLKHYFNKKVTDGADSQAPQPKEFVAEVLPLGVSKPNLLPEDDDSKIITTSRSAGRKSLSLKKRSHPFSQKLNGIAKKQCAAENVDALQSQEVLKVSPNNGSCGKLPASMLLPVSPTFSPRKKSCSSFSPMDLEACLGAKDKQSATPGFNSSMPLFSSPLPSTLVSPCGQSKHAAKRLLFPTKTSSSVRESDSLDQTADSFFGNDISLSDILDLSVASTAQAASINRYLVLEVVTQTSVEVQENGRQKPELLLRLYQENTKVEKICFLRDDWFSTDVVPGDKVQVNAAYDSVNDCYIVDHTDPESSILVNPDTLISCTSVANSISCTRRAVLADRFKGVSEPSEAMILGQMLHKIYQATLNNYHEVDEDVRVMMLEKEIERTVTSLDSLDSLYALGMSEAVAMETLKEHVAAIQDWCYKFMDAEPQPGKGDIEFRRPGDSSTQCCVCVSEVEDIEENIWSPRFGLKGKVDVTVTVKEQRVVSTAAQHVSPDTAATTLSRHVPLELKTGKMYHRQGSTEHRAQVILYGLMLSDKYASNCPTGGLLFYLKANHMQGLAFHSHEKRGLLMARNHLARYCGHQSGSHLCLPGMLKDLHTCKYCPYLKQCALYHKSIEKGSEPTSGLGELFSEQISHMTPSHLQFFARWLQLLAEEDQCCRAKQHTRPWHSTHHNREQEGLCFADMQAHPPTFSQNTGRYLQSFSKSPHCSSISTSATLSLSANDRVTISHQDGSGWAVAMGTITDVSEGPNVQVLLDKSVPTSSTSVYRIDQMSGPSLSMASCNLADLCASDSEKQHHLRQLIIERSAPRFDTNVDVGGVMDSLLLKLNADQKAAVAKVLSAKDYALILGMPGTGKTTTIACLVQILVTLGKSVLLTSYTHSAVDNILLKLKKFEVPFLRLGPLSRIHASLHVATPPHKCEGLKTVKELEEFYQSQSVVATTCLGIGHPIFKRRVFDVCIVDEASQIMLPICVGPLKYAHSFVLVGDHYQLPPLVLSQQASEGGLDVSLFRYLSECHPSSLVSLEKQYRMNREIMAVANSLVYNSRLQCGSEEVATARLSLPLRPSSTGAEPRDWLERIIAPEFPVLFLDTDNCETAAENEVKGQICNHFEANVTAKLVLRLLKYGLVEEEVGVITPLRHQQLLIRDRLHAMTTPPHTAAMTTPPHTSADVARELSGVDVSLVEVSTVDRYQGRDKKCIIVSFVRSNRKGNTGMLLQDWRRVNVAITRAKHKLLLIGSASTLRHSPFLACLLNLLAKDNSIVPLTSLASS